MSDAPVARGDAEPTRGVLPPPNEREIAERLETRARAVFGGGFEEPFRRPGDVAISPLSVGLTFTSAEALFSPEPFDDEPLTAWVHDVVGCFMVSQRNLFALSPGTPVHPGGNKVVWRLMGGSDAPTRPGCPRLFLGDPFSSSFDAGIPERVPTSLAWLDEAERPLSSTSLSGLPLRGPRIGRSTMVVNLAHAWARERWGGFRACEDLTAEGQRSATVDERIERLLRPDAPPIGGDGRAPRAPFPTGLEIRTTGNVVRGETEQIVVLPIPHTIREDARRPRSLVLVLPDEPCPAEGLTFDEALRGRVARAVAAPRATKMQVVFPRIQVETTLLLAQPAPLDTFLASAALFTHPINATQPPPRDHFLRSEAPAGHLDLLVDRPFLFAVYDDETQMPLLLGRQTLVKLMPIHGDSPPGPRSGESRGGELAPR